MRVGYKLESVYKRSYTRILKRLNQWLCYRICICINRDCGRNIRAEVVEAVDIGTPSTSSINLQVGSMRTTYLKSEEPRRASGGAAPARVTRPEDRETSEKSSLPLLCACGE